MNVGLFDRDRLDAAAAQGVRPVDTVLDIGPGLRPQGFFRPRVHLCAEPHGEYAEVVRSSLAGLGAVVLQATGQDVVRLLPDGAVNTVFLLDVIEHMEKDEGKALLAECKRVADTQVVVFTPLGFVSQDYERGEPDAWGLGGMEWQTHRSGWTPEDFDGGWTFFVCEDYHQPAAGQDSSFGAFWAIKDLDTRAERKNTAPLRIGVLSGSLPPSPLVEARVFGQILGGLNPEQYVLLASGPDPYQAAYVSGFSRMWLGGTPPLSGQAYQVSRSETFVPSVGKLVPELARRAWLVARALRRERCGVLVACSSDPLDLPTGFFASKLAGVPLYVYLFEDLVSRFPAGVYGALARLVDQVVRAAAGAIVSNDGLASVYRRRHGVSPVIVYNACPPVDGGQRAVGDVESITYAGAIEPEIDPALRALVDAAESLGAEVLLATTEAAGVDLERLPVPVRLEGGRERLQTIQADADALFLPVPFDPALREHVKSSAPYELAEYLATGRPILVHGPADSFVATYMREHECGLIVDDPAGLRQGLERFREDAALRRRFAANARARYDADFHPDQARARFLSVFERRAA